MNESNENPSSASSLNRRGFIRNTSTALAGSALFSTFHIARAQADSDSLNIALIGAGGRGRGAAAQALKTEGNVKLVAVADAFKESLESGLKSVTSELKDKPERIKVTEESKFVGLDAYKKAIAMADVVILATPPGFRPIHFEEAVRQGKHVFMEKPVAVDGPGVRRVLAAAAEAKKKNLKVGVGLQRRHQLPYLETIKRLQDGAIGDIVSMRAYWNGGPVGPKAVRANMEKKLGRPPTEMEYQVANWYMFVWLCGDHNVEQHIHNLDVINWVKGAHPVRCNGMGGRAFQKGPDSGEIFDHHAVEYEYPDGSRLFSQCRQIPGCWSSVSEHVQGTKGRSDVNNYTIFGDNAWKFRAEGARDAYQQEHDDLFDAIRKDKPFNEAEYGAHSTLTAIMGRMATYSGKIIEWDKALNSEVNVMPDEFTWEAKPKSLPDENGLYKVAIPGNAESIKRVI